MQRYTYLNRQSKLLAQAHDSQRVERVDEGDADAAEAVGALARQRQQLVQGERVLQVGGVPAAALTRGVCAMCVA